MSEGPRIAKRVFWGAVRALSLCLCAFGVVLLGFAILGVLDILAVPYLRVMLDNDPTFHEYPDYRRENTIIVLLVAQISFGIGVATYRIWRNRRPISDAYAPDAKTSRVAVAVLAVEILILVAIIALSWWLRTL